MAAKQRIRQESESPANHHSTPVADTPVSRPTYQQQMAKEPTTWAPASASAHSNGGTEGHSAAAPTTESHMTTADWGALKQAGEEGGTAFLEQRARQAEGQPANARSAR